MNTETGTPDFSDYLSIIIRRRWYIIIPLCISMTIGIWLTITLPRTYASRTMIIVEPNTILEGLDIKSPAGIAERLDTIKEQIFSTKNMSEIIEKFALFAEPEYNHLFLEDKFQILQKQIDIRVTRAKRGTDTFSISFEGKNPEKVMKITKYLGESFINTCHKDMEKQAFKKVLFLNKQLQIYERELEKREIAIRKYRQKYSGGLPEQEIVLVRELDRLQARLTTENEGLRDAKQRMILIEQQLSEERRTEDGSKEVSELHSLRDQLLALENRYTDRHPDVRRYREKISALEKKEEPLSVPLNDEISFLLPNPRITEVQEEIRRYQNDISETQEQIASCQEKITQIPKRIQELMSLERDYASIKKFYHERLQDQKKSELEFEGFKSSMGDMFKTIEPAGLPQKPVSPDVNRLLLISLAAGLCLGGILTYFLEISDKSLRDVRSVKSMTEVPLLVTIPDVDRFRNVFQRKLRTALTCASLFYMLLLLGGFALLAFKGVDFTVRYVKKVTELLIIS